MTFLWQNKALFAPNGPAGSAGSGGAGPSASSGAGDGGSPGSAVAPQAPSAPAAPTPAAPAAPSLEGAPQPAAAREVEGAFDWQDLGLNFEDEGEEPAPQPAAPEPPKPAVAPEPPKEPKQPEPAIPAAAAPERDKDQPARRPGVLGYLDEMVANKEDIVQAVSKMQFQLTEDQVAAIEKDFVAALPDLAARVWYESYTSSLNFMNRVIPQMMRQEMQRFSRSFQAESLFYQKWPGLDRSKHHNDVKQFGRVYRQMYPTASVEDFIRDVGTMVAARNNIAGADRPAAGSGTRPAARAGNGAVVRQHVEPFIPAGASPGGAGAPARSASRDANPFAGLGMEFDDE